MVMKNRFLNVLEAIKHSFVNILLSILLFVICLSGLVLFWCDTYWDLFEVLTDEED